MHSEMQGNNEQRLPFEQDNNAQKQRGLVCMLLLSYLTLAIISFWTFTSTSKIILTSDDIQGSTLHYDTYKQVSMYMSYGIFPFRIHMSNGIYQPRVINATWTGVLTEVKQ